LLAFLPDTEQRQLLKTLRLVRVTDRTVSNRRALERSLAKVRRDGYAISFGEGIVGAAAVAVPVFDVSGRSVAVISVLGPEGRLSADRLHRYAAIVRREIPAIPVIGSTD
jgi:DNA-binding IclR family transcriptional regulator